MKTFFSPQHLQHDTSAVLVDGHPFVTDEIPIRAEVLRDAAARLGPVEEPGDLGLEPILDVHSPAFVEYLQGIYAENTALYGQESPVFPETFATRPIRHRSRHIDGRKGFFCFGVGTPILSGTWTAAYWSAQCALAGAGQLKAGERSIYSLCRPPGHHAAADLYGGYCYLNNAAIAARSLGGKVAILDIDYHHGNGTQEIFYQDPSVLYCSLHADPDDEYPYFWGSAAERGQGPGEGFNANWPLPQGTGDAAYVRALAEALETIAGYSPGWLVISLGLDIGAGDQQGGFCVTEAGFAAIGRQIAQLKLPTLIVQEGGYRLDTLAARLLAFLEPFL